MPHPDRPPPKARPTGPHADKGLRPAPLRVLLVDDEQDNVASLAMLLDTLDCDCLVATAGNGLSALRVAHNFRPHVVIMDLQMPVLTGQEAARLMREQEWGRSIVLIAVSGQAPEFVQPQPLEAGFDEHMLKPLDVSWIEQRVHEWQQRTEAARRAERPASRPGSGTDPGAPDEPEDAPTRPDLH